MPKRTSTRQHDADTKAFLASLGSSSYHRPQRRAFADVVECMAIALSNTIDHPTRAQRQERYAEIVARYADDPELLARAAAALFAAIAAAGDGHDGPDVLGRVYMQLDASNDALGQFFTPYHVARMMATLTLTGAESAIATKGFISVAEPASGSGTMVLAAADVLEETGFNPSETMYVEARDTDRTAIHMVYIQMTLRGLAATAILGNTLALEDRELWFTPALATKLWTTRLTAKALAAAPPIADIPVIHTATGPAALVQPSLFDLLPLSDEPRRPAA